MFEKLPLRQTSQYFTLENIVTTAFCIIFAGFFFLDTSSHRVAMYAGFVTFIPFIYRVKIWRQLSFQNTTIISISAYLFYNISSILWSDSASLEQCLQILKYCMFIAFFVIALTSLINYKPSKIHYIVSITVLSSVISSMFLLIANIPDAVKSLSETGHYKLYGIGRGENPNMAAFLYACAIIFLHFMTLPPRAPQFIHFLFSPAGKAIITLLLFITIILTGSRNGILSLIVCFVAMSILSFNWYYLLLAPAFTAISTISFLVFPGLWYEFTSRLDTGRFEIWQQALENFKQAPIFGHGAAHEFNYHFLGMTFTAAHNIFLGHLNYLGITGLALFIFMAGIFLLKAFQFQCLFSKLPLALLIFGGSWGMFSGHTYILNLNPEWLSSWFPASILLAWQASNNRQKGQTL